MMFKVCIDKLCLYEYGCYFKIYSTIYQILNTLKKDENRKIIGFPSP